MVFIWIYNENRYMKGQSEAVFIFRNKMRGKPLDWPNPNIKCSNAVVYWNLWQLIVYVGSNKGNLPLIFIYSIKTTPIHWYRPTLIIKPHTPNIINDLQRLKSELGIRRGNRHQYLYIKEKTFILLYNYLKSPLIDITK